MTNYTGEYTGELDDGVKIDGIIDDSIWENANYLTSSFLQNENADDSFPKMQITAVPGQYGVYINSVMYDNNIVMIGEVGSSISRVNVAPLACNLSAKVRSCIGVVR